MREGGEGQKAGTDLEGGEKGGSKQCEFVHAALFCVHAAYS